MDPETDLFEPFRYADGLLRVGDGPTAAELAEAYGTPLYVYSGAGLDARFARLREAFAPISPEIRFAAKACGNVHVLRRLVGLGAGIDAVSGGEIERAWLSGCPMSSVAFAGVGKTEAEILAALDGRHSPYAAGSGGLPDPAARGPVGLLNVESLGELERVDRLARSVGVRADVALRVNPDIDAKTHPYTTTGSKRNKFGIDFAAAERAYAEHAAQRRGADADGPGARCIGLHVHIGSPVYDTEPFVQAASTIVAAAERLRAGGASVELLDLGGGWPSAYRPDQRRDLRAYVDAMVPVLRPEIDRGTRLLIEPGRCIAANAAVLLTRVQYVKGTSERRFLVTDAGMHSLIRPALYNAEHAIWPVRAASGPFSSPPEACVEPFADVVGPICESGDFLARDRALPGVQAGELLAVFSAGAYGMSMASNYNQHPRPAEVLVEADGSHRLIRRRETPADLIAPEMGL